MNDSPHASPFEAIRKFSEDGIEFWSARDLAKILGYGDFRNFQEVMKKAKVSCEESGQAISDHFGDVTDMITVGKGAKRKLSDTHLTRYACYLVVMNGDPEKPIVALGQSYFAVQNPTPGNSRRAGRFARGPETLTAPLPNEHLQSAVGRSSTTSRRH